MFSEIKHKLNLQSQKKFHKNFINKELTNIERNRIKDRIREAKKTTDDKNFIHFYYFIYNHNHFS